MRHIDLFLCGDVMTGRGIDQILPHPSRPELHEPHLRDARDYVTLAEQASGPIPSPVPPAYIWGDALAELQRRSPDVLIVNLETSITTSDDAWLDKDIHYRMHPRNVECLTSARIDVCILSNNHVLDWGRQGLTETLETLHAAGLKTAGAGRHAAEAAELAVVEVRGGGRVLVMAAGDPSSGIARAWAAGADVPGITLLDHLDEAEARALGQRLDRERRAGDLAVMSIHWGSNWGYEVPEQHVRFAHALVDRGFDVVHGHSSHHPRSIEIYRGRPIFYGCGDLLSDYEGIRGYEAFHGELVAMYFPSFDEGALAALHIVPLRLRKLRLQRASPAEVAWVTETLARVSGPFGTEVVLAPERSHAVASSARRAR